MEGRPSHGVELADMGSSELMENDGLEDDGLIGPESASTFQVIGMNTQILHVQLEPNDQIMFEPGLLMHMDPKVSPVTKCRCSLGRCAGGESQAETRLHNRTSTARVVGLTANVPGAKIIPVAMGPNGVGSKLHCLKGAWLATLGKAKISFDLDCRLLPCCFGGQGLRRQLITGREGSTVFLCGGGTVLRREMGRHERVVLDDHCLLAWTGSVTFASRAAFDGCLDLCCSCSGEGAFNFVVYGGDDGGVIYIQSMPFKKFKRAVNSRS